MIWVSQIIEPGSLTSRADNAGIEEKQIEHVLAEKIENAKRFAFEKAVKTSSTDKRELHREIVDDSKSFYDSLDGNK